MKYLIIDLANMFFRSRHSASRASSIEEKVAFAIHVTLASVNKCWREQKADHVVFALEGRSWRKSFYEPYKKNRAVAKAAMTEAEAEEDKQFWEAFSTLQDFLINKTNCTTIQNSVLEADDLIAGWIQTHPADTHVIISTDTDFHQLLAENVTQFNGVAEETYTLQGIFNSKGKPVIDKKTKLPKLVADPKWILFEKCMRGDPTDNVFSAYPGVRTKGTKNKIGLLEAFADRNNKGFAWNSLMLSKFAHHDGTDHLVLDDYNRNVILVDLSAQPEDIREQITATINAVPNKAVPQVGIHFMKFCGKYDLKKLSDQSEPFVRWLSIAYQGE